ncbi:hypothetical protein LINGRAHAP2_LOCUS6544 [Linum grandiflorum]
MNIHTICRSLPSVWEPERGVEVDEMEGGLYLFRFEHQLDVRKVVDKGPWHFNGVLLVVHESGPPHLYSVLGSSPQTAVWVFF